MWRLLKYFPNFYFFMNKCIDAVLVSFYCCYYFFFIGIHLIKKKKPCKRVLNLPFMATYIYVDLLTLRYTEL